LAGIPQKTKTAQKRKPTAQVIYCLNMTDQNTTLYTLKELSEKTGIPERSIAYYRDSYPNCLPAVMEPGAKLPKYEALAIEVLQHIRKRITEKATPAQIIEEVHTTFGYFSQTEILEQEFAPAQKAQNGTQQQNAMQPYQSAALAQSQVEAMTNIATSFTSALDLIKERTEKDQTELEQLREENKALKIANAVMKNELLNTKKQNQKSLLSRLEDLIR
jgi:hypothetical protein